MTTATILDLKDLIRTIPDYPKPGIQFRDVTTLMADPAGLRAAVDRLLEPFATQHIDYVVGIEARGFILGGAVACKAERGFVPIRKRGKLPGETIGQDYQLEYGADRVEMHADVLKKGDRVLIIDDLIATGGTAEAAIALVRRAGGVVVGAAFLVDLPDIGGRAKLEAMGVDVHVLVEFEGD